MGLATAHRHPGRPVVHLDLANLARREGFRIAAQHTAWKASHAGRFFWACVAIHETGLLAEGCELVKLARGPITEDVAERCLSILSTITQEPALQHALEASRLLEVGGQERKAA